MKTAHAKGLYAESLAVISLRVRGYKILKKRYKTSFGEIDIIAARKNTLIFVEVKARKNKGDALEAVIPRAQRRIADTAAMFLAKHPEYQNYDMRFDVISVCPASLPIHHENMWQI